MGSKDKEKKRRKKELKAARKAAEREQADAKAAAGCPGGRKCGEPRHLCRIAKEGDLERLRALVRDAAWVCGKCGRAARERRSLCRPLPILEPAGA